MPDKNDPAYLRKLLRQCLDFWADPYVEDMPSIDFFDEVNRASNWKPKPEVRDAWEVSEREMRELAARAPECKVQ